MQIYQNSTEAMQMKCHVATVLKITYRKRPCSHSKTEISTQDNDENQIKCSKKRITNT